MAVKKSLYLTIVVLGAVEAIAGGARADDWPTYRHDAARSGITRDEARPPLKEYWVFKARCAPQPAWGDPKPEPVADILELRRIHFDDVFQPVVARRSVFFGSSADNKLYCLDATTGRIRWSFITGGPVRLAPMVVDGRVYFGSDDGHAYCLDAADGLVVWKFHGASEDRRVLGNGRMISLWPLRSGVLVDDGVAYFAAGIFPAEGVFLYAVDADTGREIWCNDSTGEDPRSRISPQGYMLASDTTLYAPMGRVSPAAFDRQDGQLLHETFFGKTVGGTYALLAGQHIYTGTEEMVAYDRDTRDKFATFKGRKMVVTGQTAFLATEAELIAVDRKTRKPRWQVACPCHESLILAGENLFAGGADKLAAFGAGSGEKLWTGRVEGTVKGLAVADGRLLASTDRGMIYCFGPEGARQHGVVSQPVAENAYADSPLGPMFRQAAQEIIEQTGVTRGHCLVWGCETGQLALELARRSELMVYAVCSDGEKTAAARKALDAAGLCGNRVCVETCPLDAVPYSDYSANLIVSETALTTGELPGRAADLFRMVKPMGGTVILGQPAERPEGVRPLQAAAIAKWLEHAPIAQEHKIDRNGTWTRLVRGAIPGAGNWTHQYAEPGNTACGDDVAVKCPLGLLWFGDPGPGKMAERHLRAAAPLSLDGRMFIQGENVVMAYDAYNGVKLWERDLPGAIRTSVSHDSSNLAVSRHGLFVAVKDRCLRLDLATGRTLATYHVPSTAGANASRWGYVACVGDLLFGSRKSGSRNSDCLFSVDIADGETRWLYERPQIPNNTIAMGDGRIFLVSGGVDAGRWQEAIEENRRLGDGMPVPPPDKADVRLVVALDAKTGQVQWARPVDTSLCDGTELRDEVAAHFGPRNLAAMYHDGVLVLFCVYVDGHHWKQFLAGQFDDRRVAALSGDDGSMLWTKAVGFRVRPLIVGDTLHAEPWAFDLHTGEPRTRVHPVTGLTEQWQFARPGHHCGAPAAGENLLLFRGWNLGYYDLLGDYGTMHFGGLRPGCWINFIPAAGLLLMPEASAGCMCDFPNMCTVVFQPTQKQKAWAWYSARGPMTPVKRLGINLGAPGDRNDAAGNLWLAYPRPGHSRRPNRVFDEGSLVLTFDLQTTFAPGGGFVSGNSVYRRIDNTEEPWLFASAARGLLRCEIPLVGQGEDSALYHVRLAFVDPDHDRPGRRVFDVKLQGELVREDFDVARTAGGRNRAVFLEFDGIHVDRNLTIELASKSEVPGLDHAPILQAMEIVRQ